MEPQSLLKPGFDAEALPIEEAGPHPDRSPDRNPLANRLFEVFRGRVRHKSNSSNALLRDNSGREIHRNGVQYVISGDLLFYLCRIRGRGLYRVDVLKSALCWKTNHMSAGRSR